MCSSDLTSENVMNVNDEVINFRQYSEEYLMEAWFRMLDIVERCPTKHTQGFIIRRFYGGISAWSRLFLDALTKGCFVMSDAYFTTLILKNLFGNHCKTREECKFDKLKGELEKIVSNLQEAIKTAPSGDDISNLCSYTCS